jgi:hypothetical protein
VLSQQRGELLGARSFDVKLGHQVALDAGPLAKALERHRLGLDGVAAGHQLAAHVADVTHEGRLLSRRAEVVPQPRVVDGAGRVPRRKLGDPREEQRSDHHTRKNPREPRARAVRDAVRDEPRHALERGANAGDEEQVVHDERGDRVLRAEGDAVAHRGKARHGKQETREQRERGRAPGGEQLREAEQCKKRGCVGQGGCGVHRRKVGQQPIERRDGGEACRVVFADAVAFGDAPVAPGGDAGADQEQRSGAEREAPHEAPRRSRAPAVGGERHVADAAVRGRYGRHAVVVRQ